MIMKKTAIIIICFLICVFLFQDYENVHSEKNPPSKKILIVSIPGLSFQEIEPTALNDYPHLLKLVKQGAIGALNIRTPYKGIEDSYLTIGAGVPASTAEDFHGLHTDEIIAGEKAATRYYRYNEKMPSSEIIVPEISAIDQMNRNENYQAKPGLLGNVLEKSGISLVVMGNRDRGKSQNGDLVHIDLKRSAPLMLMDHDGQVKNGFVDQSSLVSDVERPYAVKTNYPLLQQQLSHIVEDTVLLVELGDLDRLYAEKTNYANHRFIHLKAEILSEIDQFIGEAVRSLRASDSLWVFSPQVHQDAQLDKLMLAPMIKYNHEIEQGVLISNTTRRSGVIANYDIAPSILSEFQIQQPSEFIGSPIRHEVKGNSLIWLHQELTHMEQIYKLRPKLLYPFVTFEMIVMLLGLLFVILKGTGFSRWITILLLSTLIAPLVLLYLQWISVLSIPVVIICFFIFIFILSWLMERYFPLLQAIGIISTVTVLLILLDGFLGAETMKRSVLGYDPIVGARYYGIGNEYMGVLVGSTILAVSVWVHHMQSALSKKISWTAGLIFLFVLIYLGSPMLGTNAGGAITASIAFGIAWVRMFCGKVLRNAQWARLLSFVVGFGIVAVAGLWLLNRALPIDMEQQSHIGKTMALLLEGRFDVIGGMIARKLSMNWHLIGVSSWSKVFITSLFVMTVIVVRPRGVFHRWQQAYPYLMYGFSANAVGAIIALLVNDSGIVAAATMIVYVAVPMLCLKLQDNKDSHSS